MLVLGRVASSAPNSSAKSTPRCAAWKPWKDSYFPLLCRAMVNRNPHNGSWTTFRKWNIDTQNGHIWKIPSNHHFGYPFAKFPMCNPQCNWVVFHMACFSSPSPTCSLQKHQPPCDSPPRHRSRLPAKLPEASRYLNPWGYPKVRKKRRGKIPPETSVIILTNPNKLVRGKSLKITIYICIVWFPQKG